MLTTLQSGLHAFYMALASVWWLNNLQDEDPLTERLCSIEVGSFVPDDECLIYDRETETVVLL